MIEIKIDSLSDGQKAEKFVKKYLSDAPLGFIYKSFRKKDIKLNGHWIHKDAIVHRGMTPSDLCDRPATRRLQEAPGSPKESLFPYQIVYEDSNVIIVNKPKGLLVYGDDKGVRATLGNAVLDYLYLKGEYDPSKAAFTPSPAHRLDRNTSGLVVYGKTDAALKELTDLFKERTEIEKRYLALVVGKCRS
jgi:23S rRNA pseudouridine955/2504/2580 synthase